MIRIEPGDSISEDRCEGCGGTIRFLQGYVYLNEDAHGIYFLEWCDGGHPYKGAFLTIGLGAFWEGTDSSDRVSFGIEWRGDGMRLTDEPASGQPELLGAFTPRAGALKIPGLIGSGMSLITSCSTTRAFQPFRPGSGTSSRPPAAEQVVEPLDVLIRWSD